MTKNHPDANLHAKLEGRPRLMLTLRERDYGMPCPRDRWEVKAAIDNALKPRGEGMVLYLDVHEDQDGIADDVLVIGVVNLAVALPKVRDVLKNLHVAGGATLFVEGSQENLVPDLLPRQELVRAMTGQMIQSALAECIAGAPSDWKGGTLTIQCDGNWIGYQLKNPLSTRPAKISGRLVGLCEEIAVLMWKNGNKWREAVLQFEGRHFTIDFSHDEPRHPIPRETPPLPPKPWWKLW